MSGMIFCFVGPSCAGKSTLMWELVTRFPGRFGVIKNFTSRPMRPGEEIKSDYTHVSAEEVLRRRDGGLLLNYVEYDGNHYGLCLEDAVQMMEKGITPVVVVEPSGPLQLRDKVREMPGVGVATLYVSVDPWVATERLIERAINGEDKQRVAARIIRMLKEEQRWGEARHDMNIEDTREVDIDSLATVMVMAAKGEIAPGEMALAYLGMTAQRLTA